jgi:hypothetical protein
MGPETSEDADVPALAVQGLNAASAKALQSGRPVVVVRGQQLVRLTADGAVVLKNLPPRRKLTVRSKQMPS